MRTSLVLGQVGPIDWGALCDEKHFLYRRMADEDRAVLGVGAKTWVDDPAFDADGVATEWYFGALEYEWEEAVDRAPSGVDPSPGAWFIPTWVVEWVGGRVLLHVHKEDAQRAQAQVRALLAVPGSTPRSSNGEWELRTSRDEYIHNVRSLMALIQRGDIYEVNYCIERTAKAPDLDPYAAFSALLASSQAPFAAFHRNGPHFALCASPERFLAFKGRSVLGQPMKGTRPRSLDPTTDRALAEQLAADPKERSENVMALDVMRNDLSRIAAPTTVQVTELCKVTTFPKVHQMTSSVIAHIRQPLTPLHVLQAAFPMASMTGAPKIRAMEAIAGVEHRMRGPFSGSLGFFAPDGTGDLNVVIRTVFFDDVSKQASLWTGSAITALCDPEKEWEECELKARSVIDAMRHGA